MVEMIVSKGKIMSGYKEFAGNYDEQVREYDSYGHDVLFGMGFEFVKKNDKLLDIGIGIITGNVKCMPVKKIYTRFKFI